MSLYRPAAPHVAREPWSSPLPSGGGPGASSGVEADVTIGRSVDAVPMPIVMGVVAGVFLRLGTDLVRALGDDVAVAARMVLAFLLLSAWASLGRWVPPIIGALVVGAVAVATSGRFVPAPGATQWIASPALQAPQWSVQAMIELVVPLAITVLVVQNGQGVAVLRSAGHYASVNAITTACGGWSILDHRAPRAASGIRRAAGATASRSPGLPRRATGRAPHAATRGARASRRPDRPRAPSPRCPRAGHGAATRSSAPPAPVAYHS